MPHVKPWRLAKSVEPGRFRHWRISWPPLAWPREADLIPLLRYGIDPESGTNLGYYQLLIRFLNGMILQVDIILSKQTNTHTHKHTAEVCFSSSGMSLEDLASDDDCQRRSTHRVLAQTHCDRLKGLTSPATETVQLRCLCVIWWRGELRRSIYVSVHFLKVCIYNDIYIYIYACVIYVNLIACIYTYVYIYK